MHSLLRSDPIIFQELQQLLQDTFVEASVVSGVPFHRPQQQSWKPIKVVNIFKLMLHIFEYSNFFSFSSTVNFSCARSCHYIRSSKVGTTFCTLGNWSKLLYSKRTHLWGRRRSGGGGGNSQRHHLSSNITNNILLAFKFEFTQEYSASKSRHYQTNKKVRFESHCNFLLPDRGLVMQ